MRARNRVEGAARGAVAVLLFTVLSGCTANSDEPDGQGGHSATPTPPPSATSGMEGPDAAPTASPESMFVFNTHGSEQGDADQRPEDLVASPTTTFTGLEWNTWGSGPAAGTGEVRGTWCLPDCQETPYAAEVELSGSDTVDGMAFYTDYSFTDLGDLPEEMRGRVRDVETGRLALPSGW